ncbi:hypothetical protein [Aquimarina aquimarini]|nr:hypothetical protein [Aquimarina aquimarini]
MRNYHVRFWERAEAKSLLSIQLLSITIRLMKKIIYLLIFVLILCSCDSYKKKNIQNKILPPDFEKFSDPWNQINLENKNVL